MNIFLIFFIMEVCCVFSAESPHGGDSIEYNITYYFEYKKENHP